MARRAFCSWPSLLRATTTVSLRPMSRKIQTGSSQLIQATGSRLRSSEVAEQPFVIHPGVRAGVALSQVKKGEGSIDVAFDNGIHSAFPFVWLRDNCQCPSCFDKDSSSRKFLLENLNVEEYPTNVQSNSEGIQITWSDGHQSEYKADWLHQRAFTDAARSDYSKFHALTQVPWGAGHEFDRFSYDELVSDDKRLLEWLVVMEKTGLSLVTNMPEDLGVCKLIEHVAFVRKTHYGYAFHVENRPSANNLAFTSAKLGLHNDLAYYEYIPGMIMLQCLKQHEGSGGETQVSDGLFAAEYLRQHHPEAHEILRTSPMYFWDKGTAGVPAESPRFYKLSKAPVLQYDDAGNLMAVRISQHSRDSCMAIPAETVQPFYAAMRLFYDVMETNSVTYKMQNGDMVALDNRRCQHGRLEFAATSTRHLVSAYLDLDEARCRRRELQDRLGYFHLQ